MRPYPTLPALLTFLSLASIGCGADDPATAAPDAGGAGELVMATWNLGMYPRSPSASARIGETFDALGLELLAVQEVEDAAALGELAAARGAMVALDSPEVQGTGPQLGLIWRPEAVDVADVGARLVGDPSFPRPVVRAIIARPGGGEPVGLIVVHLKAGTDPSDEATRLDAVAKLDELVARDFTTDRVIILGDFNEAPGDPRAAEVFAPFLDETGPYHLLTWPLAEAGAVTFLPASIMLDHLVVTDPLGAAAAIPEIPPLDTELADYTTTVSDHLPVVVRLALP